MMCLVTVTRLAGNIVFMKSSFFSEKYIMSIRLFLYLTLSLALMGCSVKYARYDEVIGLTPGLSENGNSLLRTSTMWSKDSQFIMLHAVRIDEHQVGVKYMYDYDFKKLLNFPEDFSFGKRLVIVPPGMHLIEIYYSGKTGYLLDSENQKHDEMISYNASIPADSVCVLLPELGRYKVDINNPKILLNCRKKQSPE